MRAAEGRFEADLHRERPKFMLSEASLAAEETRHAEEIAAHEAEVARLRSTAENTLRRVSRELQELAANLASSSASLDEDDDGRPPATAELSPGDIPNLSALSARTAELGAQDWERVLSDVEALRTEVESLRETPDDDTASVPPDEDAKPAAAKEDTGTASAEAPEKSAKPAPAAVPANAAAPSGDQDAAGDRQPRKKR
jgi:hypothetical protein